MSNAVPVHYTELLDRDHLAAVVGSDDLTWGQVYNGQPGIRCGFSGGDNMQGVLEVLSLDKDVILVLNHCHQYPSQAMQQIIGDGGWMHLQFRLNGTGAETLGDGGPMIETPDGVCVITSYPNSGVIERECASAPVQKTACLYMRPQMMERFFRIPPQAMPENMRWIADGVGNDPRGHVSSLHLTGAAAVNDMLACSFEAHARTAYMQAKSTELIAALLQSLNQTAQHDDSDGIGARDLRAIVAARKIIDANPCERLSLDQLASRVGVNRTKLALGFKHVFGETVQAYWRDRRLAIARELLRSEDLTVTQVAERAGYSEIASFTRAFTTHFGISPKQVRSHNGTAALAMQRML